MKKFTPPPQSHHNSESESEEESSEASNPADDIIRASDKTEDEYLIMVSVLPERYDREPNESGSDFLAGLVPWEYPMREPVAVMFFFPFSFGTGAESGESESAEREIRKMGAGETTEW